jgi:hypothetical protein
MILFQTGKNLELVQNKLAGIFDETILNYEDNERTQIIIF